LLNDSAKLELELTARKAFEHSSFTFHRSVFTLSDDYDESAELEQDEFDVVLQLVESGEEFYACSECSYGLTEIPNYSRYYCENCGLHY
jgi:predicted patatin/cPLA2 family phospholipase